MAFREFLEEAEGNGDHFGRLVERRRKLKGIKPLASVKVGGGNGIADVGRPKEAAERARSAVSSSSLTARPILERRNSAICGA